MNCVILENLENIHLINLTGNKGLLCVVVDAYKVSSHLLTFVFCRFPSQKFGDQEKARGLRAVSPVNPSFTT